MALPVVETARDVYQKEDTRDVINVVATGNFGLGDYAVSGPWHGPVLNSGVSGDNMSVRVKEGIILSTDELESGEDTFDTVGAMVYFKASTAKFSDTSTAGYREVGYLTAVKDSNGVIEFEKTRYADTVA